MLPRRHEGSISHRYSRSDVPAIVSLPPLVAVSLLTSTNAGLESTSSSVRSESSSNRRRTDLYDADYGTSFFKTAGIANPYTVTVATGVVNVGMTRSSHFSPSLCSRLDGFSFAVPGIYLMERLGRRKLLIYGAIWMSGCNCEFNSLLLFRSYRLSLRGFAVIVGAVSTALPGSESANAVLIAFTLLFIAAFASTW